MEVYLCAFADSRMPQTLKRVGRQAVESGFFKDVYLYDEHSFSESFKKQFAQQLQRGVRGFGYWVWKPYVVLETLRKIPERSVLLYMDAGCHINPHGKNLFDSFVERVARNESGLLVAELTNAALELYYTKGDLLDFFGIRNQKDIILTPQRAGGVFFLRKVSDKGYNNLPAIHTTNHCFHQKCTCPYNKSSSIIYSHIRHSSPIATFCYILLSDFLALVFALISFQGKNKTV